MMAGAGASLSGYGHSRKSHRLNGDDSEVNMYQKYHRSAYDLANQALDLDEANNVGELEHDSNLRIPNKKQRETVRPSVIKLRPSIIVNARKANDAASAAPVNPTAPKISVRPSRAKIGGSPCPSNGFPPPLPTKSSSFRPAKSASTITRSRADNLSGFSASGRSSQSVSPSKLDCLMKLGSQSSVDSSELDSISFNGNSKSSLKRPARASRSNSERRYSPDMIPQRKRTFPSPSASVKRGRPTREEQYRLDVDGLFSVETEDSLWLHEHTRKDGYLNGHSHHLPAKTSKDGAAIGRITNENTVAVKKKKKKIVNDSGIAWVKKVNGEGSKTSWNSIGSEVQECSVPESQMVDPIATLTRKKKKKRSRAKPKVFPPPIVPVKPMIQRHFLTRHPLIPDGSDRIVAGSSNKDLYNLFPEDPPETTLSTLCCMHPLLQTQCTVIEGQWKRITKLKLFLRRNFTYSLNHRRFAPPLSRIKATLEMKKQNLECIVRQIEDRLMNKNSEKKNSASYNFPVDLEINMVTLMKPVDGFRNGFTDSKREVHLQCAILRKNPKIQLGREMLTPTLAQAPLLVGQAVQNPNGGNRVTFLNGRIRLDSWSMNDYLVVKLDSQPEKCSPRTCAFNIADIKDGLSLEVKDYYAMKVTVRKHAVLPITKIDYKWAIIYPSGKSYQVRELALLKANNPGHSCQLCSIRCDSLLSLLRHISGFHPFVGYDYDPMFKRLYVWFAPENEYVREDYPGFTDNWSVIQFGRNWRGSLISRHASDSNADYGVDNSYRFTKYPDGKTALIWIGNRRRPKALKLTDALPTFNVDQVLRAFGVPIAPIRQYLHSNAVRSVQPIRAQMWDYDSDEDAPWQDRYEREKIHDFIDVNISEKYFFCLWNGFTRRLGPIFSVGMRDVLCRFVQEYAGQLDMADALPSFYAHLSMFRRLDVITANECLQVIRILREALEPRAKVH